MYKIIKQKRKSVTIRIDEELNILVKAPYTISDKEVQAIIKQNEDWINKTLKEKEVLMRQKDWLMNGEILYLGEKLQVCIEEDKMGKVTVGIEDGIFKITTPNKNDHFLIKSQVDGYIKKQALTLFTVLTERYCKLIKCQYQNITLRKQKTRWGSCSNKGNLSYNLRLMSAPIEIIEYVVLHEVMHLKYFDHSRMFWNAIEDIMPDYKIRQNYLKQQGYRLDI